MTVLDYDPVTLPALREALHEYAFMDGHFGGTAVHGQIDDFKSGSQIRLKALTPPCLRSGTVRLMGTGGVTE